MNIFLLDEDKQKNVQYYTDKHVVKMIVEYTQLLSSAYYFTDFVPEGIYKLYGKNHPDSIWVRESQENWLYLKELTVCLVEEYEYRFQKTHKSKKILEKMPNPNIKSVGLTPFPQVMPESYQNENVYLAYQTYYIKEKTHLFSWKGRDIPPFIKK